MSATTFDDDTPVRARIPADLDTPDQLVAGLSARQVAVLAVAAVPLYALWQGLGERLPVTALLAITAALAAPAIALALGRRDGLGLDQWLLAALRFRRGPRELAPGPSGPASATPAWASPARTGPRRCAGAPVRPAVLNLPATAIAADGTVSAGNGTEVVLLAASTVTTGLHTDAENRALVAGYARWLNSLTGPVQVLVSSRRVDLGARALRVAEAGARLPHPALARAALEHAEFLLDLDEDGDRLARTVTIACTGSPPRTTGAPTTSTRTAPGPWPAPTSQARVRPGGGRARVRPGGTGEAAQRAARAAAALGALGSRCRVLTGAQVTSVLTTAAAPFAPGSSTWERTPPLETVTGPAAASGRGQPPGIPGADEDQDSFDHGQQEQW